MSKITVLAEGQITPSTDVLITELSQSNELPAVILLKWRARSVRHTSCHLGHRLSRWHGSLRGNQFRRQRCGGHLSVPAPLASTPDSGPRIVRAGRRGLFWTIGTASGNS
jgi:hypothetical protein